MKIPKAFTLIELLMVIVILGIILSLLFPALGRVREGARRAQCANNLRQHGIAWYLYLDDHDEMFPTTEFSGAFGGKVGSAGCPFWDGSCGTSQKCLEESVPAAVKCA